MGQQLSVLDQGHNQKLSKIETLRLAQNYIRLLTFFLTTNKRLHFEDLHHMLTRNLSPATGNLMRTRLPFDLDYSIARNIISEGASEYFGTEDCHNCSQPYFAAEEEEDRGYTDYLEVDPYYGCCYK